MTEQFAIWCIYENPKDYPEKFVARKFLGESATDNFIVVNSLVEIKRLFSSYAFLSRNPEDDPIILGTYL